MIRNVVLSAVLAGVVVLAILQGSDASSDENGSDFVSKNAPGQEGDSPAKAGERIAQSGLTGLDALSALFPEGKGKTPAEEKAKDADAKKAGSKKTYAKADPKMGHFEGVVILTGKPPKLDPFAGVPANNKDAKFCASRVKDERLLVSKKGGIQNCVVTISEKKRFRKKPKARVHTIDNSGCTFVPHISAMPVGSTVKVTSQDAMLHNSQGLLAMSFNSVVTKEKPYKNPTPARKPGMCLVRCSFHSWMNARIHILPHEYFDVTDADGNFKIMNIPPGTYEFEVRHEVLAPYLIKKSVKKKFTIKKGQTTKVTFPLMDPKL